MSFFLLIVVSVPTAGWSKTYNLTYSNSEALQEIDKMKLQIEQLNQLLEKVKKPFKMPSCMKLCDVNINFDDPFIYRRVKKEINEIVFNEGMLGNLVDFSGEFFPVIEPILAKHGVPDDLKYLVAVESNFKIKASSYAGARGPWQFIDSSAKLFGLKFNKDYDERYNLELATEAAIKHLLESYRLFGDWLLAITAYNKGNRGVNNILSIQGIELSLDDQPSNGGKNGLADETSVEAGEISLENYMAEQRDSNFWDLVLLVKLKHRGRSVTYTNEQERYVPRVLAMKLILENVYESDFLKFDPDNKLKPIPTDTVVADKDMSSLEIAKTLGISLWNLKYLNPEYKGLYPVFPRGKEFLLPAGLRELYEQKKDLIKAASQQKSGSSKSSSRQSSTASKRESYKKGDPLPDSVKLTSGETLWDISQHYGVAMNTLLKLNKITYRSARYLKPGQIIRLK